MATPMYRVTWYLGGNQRIEKVGAGVQQIFATMTPAERRVITLRGERTVSQLLPSKGT